MFKPMGTALSEACRFQTEKLGQEQFRMQFPALYLLKKTIQNLPPNSYELGYRKFRTPFPIGSVVVNMGIFPEGIKLSAAVNPSWVEAKIIIEFLSGQTEDFAMQPEKNGAEFKIIFDKGKNLLVSIERGLSMAFYPRHESIVIETNMVSRGQGEDDWSLTEAFTNLDLFIGSVISSAFTVVRKRPCLKEIMLLKLPHIVADYELWTRTMGQSSKRA